MTIDNHPGSRVVSNGVAAPRLTGSDVIAELDRVFAVQRNAFRTQGAPDLARRRQQLRAIERLLVDHRDEFAAVSVADFGTRGRAETEIAEIVTSLASVRYMRRHLRAWTKPRRRSTSIWFKPGISRVIPQPKGVVGVMVPWNFPIHLAIVPIATALAAGNRVMVKASEYTPATAQLLKRLLATEFDSDTVYVTDGERDVSEAFSRLPFGHLLFTGSTNVGRSVAQAAAANLTPVTLELGGKSPVVVAPDYSLERAAKSIVWGRLQNGGQICVAPDYVLVPEGKEHDFAHAAQRAAEEMYPTIAGNPDYTPAIHQGEYDRLQSMLSEVGSASLVTAGGQPAAGVDERKVPLTVVVNPPADSQMATREIFGPILPIFGYRDLDDAIAHINNRDEPLALYVFSDKRANQDAIISRTASGGVTVNDTLLHYLNPDLPFGGVGASGMGAYHGREGFDTFSHLKSVFYQRSIAGRTGVQLLYPPYGRVAEILVSLMRKF